MSHTYHHDRFQKRFKIPGRVSGLPHAPSWYRRMLNRLLRAKQNREVKQHNEVLTIRRCNADYSYW